MADQINSIDQLIPKLKEILESWPLYRIFVYQGRGAHTENLAGDDWCGLPATIKLYCDHPSCMQETWWAMDGRNEDRFFFSLKLINDRSYTCRNCGENRVYYQFIWQQQETENIFLKVGQYPELEERVPEALAKALDPDDLKLYKKAIRMRNFNLGLAAVAYMRRVIENKMGGMLEILYEAAVAHNASADLLARHEKMKNEKRFSVKIEYAGDLLPLTLRPPGKPNPMAILHELVSDGLHAKSDEECVDIFDKCRTTFEYVFAKVRIEVEDAKNFVKAMQDLAQERARAADDKSTVAKS